MVEKRLSEIIPDVYTQIEKNYKSQPYIVTGYEELDDLLGRYDSGIITIAARPAMGKTAFMYSIMEHLLIKNKKVLLFTLELSKEQAVQRFFSIIGEIDPSRLYRGNLTQADWEKLAETITKMDELELYINDKSAITVEEIEESIKQHKPDFVCIDYLQLINIQNKKDRNFQIEDIMQKLSKVAKDNGIVIYLLSQLSRATEMRMDRRPILSDLRGSSAVETISDVVIFLYRPEYYGCDEDEIIRKGESEIIVAKNKFGTTGTVSMIFKPNCLKFYSALKVGYEF